ncbi:MAG: ribosome-associated translation inhibitor RaiA [bacterium]|nr:ribosome-associated translation inhibitor RaiA [bacterium]
MHLDIKGIGIELTPALKQYIEERIGGLSHFIGSDAHSSSALVEVGRSTHHHEHGDVMFAKANVHLGGKTIRAEAQTQDVRSAIDEVRQELHNEILKFKGKRKTLFRRGARSIKKLLHLSPFARFRKSSIAEDVADGEQ